MNKGQVSALILPSPGHGRGGVMIHEAALKCAVSEGLEKERQEYLPPTRKHVQSLQEACVGFGPSPEQETPRAARAEQARGEMR